MDITPDIYFSLDEARAELARRRQDSELRAALETELGDLLWPECREQPVAYISQQLLSPGNGFVFFCHAARYVGAMPFAGEFLEDCFSYKNGEKSGLGRLRALEGGRKMLIDIIRLRHNDRKRLCDIVTRTGETLRDFHHQLLHISGYHVAQRDMSGWYRAIGRPSEYYYPYLLHFVTHGVLFENFQTYSDEGENLFTQTVVLPALRKVEERFGLKPLVVRLYPEEQSEDEDFYWWCYPPRLNDYLVKYGRQHNLPMRYLDETT